MRLDEARRASGSGEVRASSRLAAWRIDGLRRYSWVLYAVILLAGLAITWGTAGVAGPRRLWLALPGFVSAHSSVGLSQAIVAVTGLAVLLAFAAALLRTWARAYAEVGTELRRGGPYHFLRAPLSLGMLLHALALCVLLSWGGALFVVIAVVLVGFAFRGDEGARRSMAEGGPRPQWAGGLLKEIYVWGAAVTFAVFGWGYNSTVIFQGLLVSAGVAILAQGLLRKA